MAHYAFINEENIVVEVIVGRDENDLVEGVPDWETYYGEKRPALTCLRTSYNTRGGKHALDGEPFRMNYAGKGFTYDADRDAFIPPKPYESWVLDDSTCLWVAPVPMPEDGQDYTWDEQTTSWVEVPGETV